MLTHWNTNLLEFLGDAIRCFNDMYVTAKQPTRGTYCVSLCITNSQFSCIGHIVKGQSHLSASQTHF